MNSTCSVCDCELSPWAQFGQRCAACLLSTALESEERAEVRLPIAPPSPGRFGDYRLLAEIGRGGMGIVYRAHHVSLNRLVALKVLFAGPGTEAEQRHRFSIEAQSAAALQHPGIVTIYEIGEQNDLPYMTMSLVEGSNLAQLCNGTPFGSVRTATLLASIADAVQHAHERGIFHLDLKPSNILVDRAGNPQVTDFGIAKRRDETLDATLTGQVLGTPNYLSPEQASGRRTMVGPATDIYGLGTILYYLMTGRPPFPAVSLVETLRLVLEADPQPPRLLNPAIARDLEVVCLKCLEKDPLRRYQSAAEFARDLRRYLRNSPIVARPPGRLDRLSRRLRSNRRSAGLATMMAVVLTTSIVISAYGVMGFRQAERNSAAKLRGVNIGQEEEAMVERECPDMREKSAKAGLYSRKDYALNRLLLSRTLALTGDIRMEQERYDDAEKAYREAFDQAVALATQFPTTIEFMRARGEAEYGLGSVYAKRGDLTKSRPWLGLYHQTCAQLVSLTSRAPADFASTFERTMRPVAAAGQPITLVRD